MGQRALVEKVSGAVFEQGIIADLPATTRFLSPWLFADNGATAAAVAYGFSGVYVESDCCSLVLQLHIRADFSMCKGSGGLVLAPPS
jgi:hypothetical protein